MKLTSADLFTLAKTAKKAAQEAGHFIAQAAKKTVATEFKPAGSSPASQVVTEVDRHAQEIILEVLRPTLGAYQLGLLTEESPDDHSRFERDYFWCVDPLDGTLSFTQTIPGYAVSIALVSKLGVPQIGVVFDPVKAILYHAVKGQGAFIDGQPWVKTSKKTNLLTCLCDPSFQHHPTYAATLSALEQVVHEMGFSGFDVIVNAGAVMNAVSVLEQAPACYFKLPKPQEGGGSLWDFAATACIFAEVGSVASDISGNPIKLNNKDSTFMNHHGVLYASDQALAKSLIKHLPV